MADQYTTDDDDLAGPRDAVAQAIVALQGFTGNAGSRDMRAVQSAIEYLGCAYSILKDRSDANPAWPS